jgi:hypothetical protein
MTDFRTTDIPDTLDQYSSVFVCLGVYPDNHVLSNSDGQKLANYLNSGGRLYMEGGDTWKFDPQTAVHPMFRILGVVDGGSDLGTILGYNGTFTEGMSFLYTGDNQYIDHILSEATAFHIFKNQNPFYDNAVAFDGGTYLTIGSSFEFGGLSDGSYPSTKTHLMEKYLSFFGIEPPPLRANFIGFPTSITTGEDVTFTDYSTGGVSAWTWSFPGGTPSASGEQNPVITYNDAGTYDVQLIVFNGSSYDTLLRPGYIHVDYPTGIKESRAKLSCIVQPNPNNGMFKLNIRSMKDEVVNIRLLNTLGSIVYEHQGIQVNEKLGIDLNMSNLPGGIYFMNIKGKESTLTQKVLIRK